MRINSVLKWCMLAIALSVTLSACQTEVDIDISQLPESKKLTPEYAMQYQPSAYPIAIEVGLVVGDHVWISSEQVLYSSTNAGRDWMIVNLPNPQDYPVGLQQINAGQSLVVITQSGKKHITNDQGLSWESIDFHATIDALLESRPMNSASSISKAWVDASGERLIIVFECEVMASDDGGQHWQVAIEPAKLPRPDRYYYCAEDLALDERFKPKLAQMHMTGSVRTGLYILAKREDEWRELCTPDATLAILNVAPDCKKQTQEPLLNQLTDSDAYYQWLLIEDLDQRILHTNHQPFVDALNFEHSSQILIGDNNRHWYFSPYGIAITQDYGEHWETLIGGGGVLSSMAMIGPSQWLGINRGVLYQSDDQKIWQRVETAPEVWRLHQTDKGALAVIDDKVLLYQQQSQSPTQVLPWPAYDMVSSGQLIWVVNDNQLAVSSDGGENWAAKENDEFEEIVWSCSKQCLGISTLGNIYRARFIDAGISVFKVNQQGNQDYYYPNEVWADDTGQVWMIEYYTESNDDAHYWLTTDAGEGLSPVAFNNDKVLNVIFHADQSASVISEHGLHRIDTQTRELTSQALPNTLVIHEACETKQGLLAALAYTDDEDWTFYLHPDSTQWFVDPDNTLWCES